MTTPVVLITGALTGIGRATALAFAREGARVVVSGRRDEAGQALAAEARTAALGTTGSGTASPDARARQRKLRRSSDLAVHGEMVEEAGDLGLAQGFHVPLAAKTG
jgi:NAD(P)-dependent dehydrogenase (short-subunit alcohol dehydrogenase family)